MKNKVLVKLAQSRLAINYVLRNRMVKQADRRNASTAEDYYIDSPNYLFTSPLPSKDKLDSPPQIYVDPNIKPPKYVNVFTENPYDNGTEFSETDENGNKLYYLSNEDMYNHYTAPETYPHDRSDAGYYTYPIRTRRAPGMVYPGDKNYDYRKGFDLNHMMKTTEFRFSPYKYSTEPFKVPFKNTIYSLTPQNVMSNENHYLNNENNKVDLHTRLFGVPEYFTNRRLDKEYNMRNGGLALLYADLFPEYMYSQSIKPDEDIAHAIETYDSEDIQKNQPTEYLRAKNFLKSRNIPVEDPNFRENLWDNMSANMKLYESLSEDAQLARETAERNYSDAQGDILSPKWNAKRDRLMHAYIDRTPVGIAHKSGIVPKGLTTIPYYAYHMLPYSGFGQRQKATQKNIEGLKKNIALTRKENPWLDKGIKTVGNVFNQASNLYNSYMSNR